MKRMTRMSKRLGNFLNFRNKSYKIEIWRISKVSKIKFSI